MTPLRRAQVVCIESLAAGVPAKVPGFSEVSRQLRGGALDKALVALGFPGDFAAVISRWPLAASAAWRRVEALPAQLPLAMSLMQTAAYGAFIFGLERTVWWMLTLKVFSAMPFDGAWLDLGSSLVELAALLFIALGVLGVGQLSGWRWLSPWRRHLDRARAFALLAALRETNAPDDVRAACVALLPAVSPETRATSLEQLVAEHASRAAVSMERAAALERTAMYVMLLVGALGISLSLYGSLPLLSQVTP